MHSTDQVRGMFLPLPTVFDPLGEVDEPLMRNMARFYVDAGIHAFFLCGSFGQGPAMRSDQRKRVVEVVLQEVQGRIPIVVHVGAVDPYTSVDLAVHARENGADAIGLVGPYYYTDRTEDELVLHFQMVDAAANLPILVYNNPGYQGYPITPPLMAKLVKNVPHIFGAKLAMGTVAEGVQYLLAIPNFSAFTLADDLVQAMRVGVKGTVSPPLAATPRLGVALVRAIEEGRQEDAVRLQAQAKDVNDMFVKVWKQYGRAVYGEGLRALGFPVQLYPRWPAPPLPDSARQLIHATVQAVGEAGTARNLVGAGAR